MRARAKEFRIKSMAVLKSRPASLERRRTPVPHRAVSVVGQRVGDTATLPCTYRSARRVAMSSTSTAAQSPRSVVRAMRRIPVRVVEIAEGEGVNGF